jgi:sugar phosphate isomerase/epimerase
MELGIFARTYARPTLESALDAVRADGLDWVQLNLSSAGLPTVPEALPSGLAERVCRALAERGLRVAALSGTINLIHPDLAQRTLNVRHLAGLIAASPALGATTVSLCTGTRDPNNMWRRHPDNATPQAWADLLNALSTLVPVAEAAGVTLGVEPEAANVVSAAPLARRLLDEVGSPALRIVFDGANLVAGHPRQAHAAVLGEAADLLAPDVISAHAKQLDAHGRELPTADPTGTLDYDLYLAVLRVMGYTGPLLLHGLPEAAVPESVRFLNVKLENLPQRLEGTMDTKS